MKAKNSYIVIVSILILGLCFFTNAIDVNAQEDEKITSASNNEVTGASEESESELALGYWQLTENKAEIYNVANRTKWEDGPQVNATSSWKDYLEIEHTIRSGFKWDAPPEKLQPGKEIKLSGAFEDKEFSTCAKIQSGIKIYVSEKQKGFLHPNAVISNVINMKKDAKVHNTEVTAGSFAVPKLSSSENNVIHLTIDCYIGSDHFVSTYTYLWVPSRGF